MPIRIERRTFLKTQLSEPFLPMKKLNYFSALLVLCGCSAHSPFITQNTTSSSMKSASNYPAHSNVVFVTTAAAPPELSCEVIEKIDIGNVWYTASRTVRQSLADRAREVGADAVVEVKEWRQMSGFSWSAPHGSGKAIKIPAGSTNLLTTLNGDWL